MNDRHASNGTIDHFMQALDEETPYERARFPSGRLIWLRAKWAKKREREERITRIRLLIESVVQVLVGGAAVLTGVRYWPEIQASVGDLASLTVDPTTLLPVMLIAAAVSTLFVSVLGMRIMLRA